MKRKQKRDRKIAIERYASGEQITSIARSLGYSRQWVYKWIERHNGADDVADWNQGRSPSPHSNPRQLAVNVVEAVKLVRLSLYNEGLFCGAQAIEWELDELGVEPLPSLRTINRILSREELTHRRTGAYEPKGRKYPALVANEVNQVHQTDYVGPCYLNLRKVPMQGGESEHRWQAEVIEGCDHGKSPLDFHIIGIVTSLLPASHRRKSALRILPSAIHSTGR